MMETIRCWGSNEKNQLDNVPTDNGYCNCICKFSVALKNDGTIKSWGYNGDGQLNNVPTDNGYIALHVD